MVSTGGQVLPGVRLFEGHLRHVREADPGRQKLQAEHHMRPAAGRLERAAGLAGPGVSLRLAGRGRQEAADSGRIGVGGPAVGAMGFANCHDSDCAWLAWRAAASWHGPFWRVTKADGCGHDQTGICLRNQTWPFDIWHVHYDKEGR